MLSKKCIAAELVLGDLSETRITPMFRTATVALFFSEVMTNIRNANQREHCTPISAKLRTIPRQDSLLILIKAAFGATAGCTSHRLAFRMLRAVEGRPRASSTLGDSEGSYEWSEKNS